MADVAFVVLDETTAEEAFSEPKVGSKWATAMKALMDGEAIFIPAMSRLDLESLRNALRYRTNRVLKSRTVKHDDTPGRLLQLTGIRRHRK